MQLVANNARAATVIAKLQQRQLIPDIQHLALWAARQRAERQALRNAQPELWTVFSRVDAVCRCHARRRRNQGWVITYLGGIEITVSAIKTEALLMHPLAAARTHVRWLRVGNHCLP
ncbi:hypothetical protein HPB52_003480 [Rhipicephalus sanguineus]|uniref:Uncharacterized protein n=1 Tax=Rhipicephalus sanguineus TaxID=34632 RepID=A0A9D4Q8X0_RHISA|nr:hypothetical protein HPB52_003480 [Rhipicephalus sanguineus]